MKKRMERIGMAIGLLCCTVLYPAYFVFSKIVNTFFTRSIRNRDGELQTPIVYFEHPETKRTVIFIGVIHMADAKYFEALQSFIDVHPAYTVLFEGVGRMTWTEWKSLTKKEKLIAKQFHFSFKTIREVGRLLNLQNQKDGLSYDKSWKRTDMRNVELVKLFAEHNQTLYSENAKFQNPLLDGKNDAIVRWTLNKAFCHFHALTSILDVVAYFSKKRKIYQNLILDKRNVIAIQAIEEYALHTDIITIWGAGHFPGMSADLKKMGYMEVSRDWYTAYTDRKYSWKVLLDRT